MRQENCQNKQQTLLIVDDDAPFVRVLGRAMSREGFAVWPAETVAQAKNAIDAVHPDFAVVDLHLNTGSGFEVLQYIQEQSPHTRSVLLSGYATPASAVRAMKLGAIDCLPKPVAAEALANSLSDRRNDAATLSEATMEPSEARLHHVLARWEKNNRNTMQTAKTLGMHRRTLQRILKRAGFGRSEIHLPGEPSQFSKLRRLYQVWSRSLDREAIADRPHV